MRRLKLFLCRLKSFALGVAMTEATETQAERGAVYVCRWGRVYGRLLWETRRCQCGCGTGFLAVPHMTSLLPACKTIHLLVERVELIARRSRCLPPHFLVMESDSAEQQVLRTRGYQMRSVGKYIDGATGEEVELPDRIMLFAR